ncbi:MAG: hypothetical protein IKN12_01980, partial [Selenomonadaceae bacterium]|nr:hypothetical protein [Selenomonadaceae bacterium]
MICLYFIIEDLMMRYNINLQRFFHTPKSPVIICHIMIGIGKAIKKWAVARIGKLLFATTRFLLFGRDGNDKEYYFGGKQITQFPKKRVLLMLFGINRTLFII